MSLYNPPFCRKCAEDMKLVSDINDDHIPRQDIWACACGHTEPVREPTSIHREEDPLEAFWKSEREASNREHDLSALHYA